jgi:predicted RNA-binding Zn-ribbon protein involved in translation (DUF1610 family)
MIFCAKILHVDAQACRSLQVAKKPKDIEETRYIRELRKENIKLKRENAQLRKRATRLEMDWLEMDSQVDEELEKNIEKLKKKDKKADKIQCPKCGSYDIIELELRDMPYYKCHSCGSKGRLSDC